MMNKKIRWGVLGYARIASQSVIPALMKAKNAEFYAIASRHREHLDQCLKDFGCEKAYQSYEELLDDPKIDAVYIPLPNALHRDWTIKAALKGKHILCEKPLVLTAQQAQEMFQVCERQGVLLMEAFMYRFTHRTKRVKEVLESGLLGEIKQINSSFRFHLNRENSIKMNPELGGGSLYDVGCYPINFVGMITDKYPVSMTALCEKSEGVDVSFSAILKYDDGLLATVSSGFNSFRRAHSEIVGTKGVLEIPETFIDQDQPLILMTAEGRKEIPVEPCQRYVLEVEHFSEVLLNHTKPLLGADETIRNIRLIEELMHLIATGE